MKNNKELYEAKERLDRHMDLRVKQLKDVYEHRWYEASLRDDLYRYLCWQYAYLKMRLSGYQEPTIIEASRKKKELLELADKTMLDLQTAKEKLT